MLARDSHRQEAASRSGLEEGGARGPALLRVARCGRPTAAWSRTEFGFCVPALPEGPAREKAHPKLSFLKHWMPTNLFFFQPRGFPASHSPKLVCHRGQPSGPLGCWGRRYPSGPARLCWV